MAMAARACLRHRRAYLRWTVRNGLAIWERSKMNALNVSSQLRPAAAWTWGSVSAPKSGNSTRAARG
eukprot:3098380-Heterocapsa_arctica.AAC.1